MKYFDNFKMIKSDRIRKLPLEFELSDFTVLIGKNGSGKTTILQSIVDDANPRTLKHSKIELNMTELFHSIIKEGKSIGVLKLFYSDLSKIKPNIDMYPDTSLAAFDIANSFKSAGERSRTQLKSIEESEGNLILIDEMDASLDWRQQKKVYSLLKKLSKKNQVIVATHSFIIATSVEKAFDVGERRWYTKKELKEKYL